MTYNVHLGARPDGEPRRRKSSPCGKALAWASTPELGDEPGSERDSDEGPHTVDGGCMLPCVIDRNYKAL